jgi:hypothetical protein
VRRLYTMDEFQAAGRSRDAVRWGERKQRWRKVIAGVYGEGADEPTEIDRARAVVLRTGGVASGSFAGFLHGLDSVDFIGPDFTLPPTSSGRRAGVRRRIVPADRIVERHGVLTVDGLQVLLDLAAELDDLRWEQALESALRKRLTTVAAIEPAVGGVRSADRIRRVLALRPEGAPPTESLLETLMVQLVRTVPGLADPARQFHVYTADDVFIARVDLCWPDLGLFIELDGQHHKDQPVYDARRETAVVAATGWLCGRFTWREVVYLSRVTAKRLADVVDQARRRPMVSG